MGKCLILAQYNKKVIVELLYLNDFMWNTEWVCNKAAVQLLEVYNFTTFWSGKKL